MAPARMVGESRQKAQVAHDRNTLGLLFEFLTRADLSCEIQVHEEMARCHGFLYTAGHHLSRHCAVNCVGKPLISPGSRIRLEMWSQRKSAR